jgi:hypothetical protein
LLLFSNKSNLAYVSKSCRTQDLINTLLAIILKRFKRL